MRRECEKKIEEGGSASIKRLGAHARREFEAPRARTADVASACRSTRDESREALPWLAALAGRRRKQAKIVQKQGKG